jgi:predicted PurR-regulated permease PerM
MTKQIAIIGAAILTTLLSIVVIWQLRIVLIHLMVSLMIAATMRPLVARLIGKRIIARLALLILYLAVFFVIGFLLYLTGEKAINEMQWFVYSLSEQDGWTLPIWLEGNTFFTGIIETFPPPSQLIEAITGSQGQLVLPAILGLSKGVGNIVSDVLVILFLTVYWILSQVHFERLWLSLLPSGQRGQARGIWRKVEPEIGAYFRSQIFLSVLAGLLLGLGYWALGSPYPVLLGLSGALIFVVPVVGAVLAVIPPLLVGLLSSVEFSLVIVLYTLIIVIALSIWIRPIFYKRIWKNPILTIVLLIALADSLGIIGIILAPVLSIICQILWKSLVSHRRVSGAANSISELKNRKDQIWSDIQAMEGPPLPLLSSSLERLSTLIEKAEPLLSTITTIDSALLLSQKTPVLKSKADANK